MLKTIPTNRFRKDMALMQRRGFKMDKLEYITDRIAKNLPLEHRNRPHMLSGNWAGHWECHIEPDWLLIYQLTDTELYLVRTGTHADVF